MWEDERHENELEVNFLNVTINLRKVDINNRKPKTNYFTYESSNPQVPIVKQISQSIHHKLTDNSSNETDFNEANEIKI